LKAAAPVEALVAVGTSAGSERRNGGLCCGMDNIFVERLWRSLKYQEVYAYANVAEGKAWYWRLARLLQLGTLEPESRLSHAAANLPGRPVDM
jgi:hypothetical protein